MKNTDIAIVGMSCFFPGAKNIDDFWDNLQHEVSSITEVPTSKIDSFYFKEGANQIDRFYCRKGGFVPAIKIDVDKLGLSSAQIKEMDPVHLLALKLVYQALDDASVFDKNVSLKNSSLIIGKENYISSHELNFIDVVHTGEQIVQVLKNALPALSNQEIERVKEAYQKEKNILNEPTLKNSLKSVATVIANNLNIEGASYTIDASEASSLFAIDNSIQELLRGNVEIAIAGGIHFSQNTPCWSVFSKTGMLSKKQQIKPFSEEADGTLLGEGAGFVVLKKLNKAITDGDKIYAIIKGIGTNSGGNNTFEGAKKAIQKAWEKSQITATDLGYIETNGTALKEEDTKELNLLSQLFKNQNILIGTVKSNIGHTLSASGIAGLIKTALALYHREIPATLNCEIPSKILKETLISPVTKSVEWNEKIPFMAGVNAFGFDGTSAHVVLQVGHHKKQKLGKPVFEEDVIAISAHSKEALLEAIDQRKFSISDSGDYRLVLFNPTADRLEKAKRLISKNKPWRGRQDIWFSNQPLLKGGGKVAFLFPGFDPTSDTEIESVVNCFGYEVPKEIVSSNFLLNQSFKQLHTSEIINSSLRSIGVVSDMNAGHSLGEWLAANAAGLFSHESVVSLLESMDPEKYELNDAYFIAIGAGLDKISHVLKEIPDLYLSNDNCPNQVLLCGTGVARDRIIEFLKSEQIFYQILTFQSGFHSPFMKDRLDTLDEALKFIKITKNEIPVWSATTLETYPDTLEDFKILTEKHLTQTVFFRQLIEKLYLKENARVFIQVGNGTLTGFVDDTLKNKEYAALSSCVPTKSTLEQLRRILALLFIEGKSVDISFLGLQENFLEDKEIELIENTSIVTSFPLLQELAHKVSDNSQNSESFESLFIQSEHPVVQAMNENMKELISMQKEFATIVQQGKHFNFNIPPKQQKVEKNIVSIPKQKKERLPFVENLYVSLEDHPYLIDHSLAKQPKHWTILEDINPVIPMTMTFELVIEAAHKQDPEKKVLSLGPISVFQWMKVFEPFKQTIEGSWKTEDTISLKIKNFLNGEVKLGDVYPAPDAEYVGEIDLGENIVNLLPTPEIIYKKHMFHGPGYQGITQVTHVTKKGLRGIIKKSEGKGSLLDCIGQLYGLYLQLTLDENSKVSFPVKIEEINFYQDVTDQQGTFECFCLPTSIKDQIATANIVIKRDGKIWCIIKGWKNQIFEGFDDQLWNMTMNPSENFLAKKIEPNIYFFDSIYNKAVNWEFLKGIYLSQEEKHHYDSLMLNKKKDFLISRITLKDVVRKYINDHSKKKYFPVEIQLKYDANGKPHLRNIPESETLEISIAHKGSNAVSIISDKPVGIDIEIIEERGKGFMELSFTEKELDLLKDRDQAEWITRFWVAKEAYGKMLGVGLQGNPKQYEIESIDGERIIIRNTGIKTIIYNSKFIVGWTE